MHDHLRHGNRVNIIECVTFHNSPHSLWHSTHILFLLTSRKKLKELIYTWLTCYVISLWVIFPNLKWQWKFNFNKKSRWWQVISLSFTLVILRANLKYLTLKTYSSIRMLSLVTICPMIWKCLIVCEPKVLLNTINSE